MVKIVAVVIFAISVLLFMVMEAWRERKHPAGLDESQDDGTLKLIHRCRNAAVLVVFLSAVFPLVKLPIGSAAGFLTGAALALIGTGTRFGAVSHLGRWFTNVVTTQAEQKIVRDGLYRYIRHPSYTGSLIFFLGIGISTGSVWGAVLVMALMSYALLRRIKVEEKVLAASFGQEYLDYMKTTKKLVPFIF
jgi:protein-S-isoprenylcysteine O-methyltransferase